MFGSPVIEVAIGLILVYLLLSLVCSAFQESLESWTKIRASHLEQGLRELLRDSDGTRLLQDLYNHPMIYGLFRGDYDPAKVRSGFTTTLPTYIPAANFAVALMDTLVRGPLPRDSGKNNLPPVQDISFEGLRTAVANNASLEPSVQRVLLMSLDSANGDLSKAQAQMELWFNSGMERVSGWYKRRMQAVLLGLGLAVAVFLNVDSIKLASELYHNDLMRAAAVAQASSVTKNDTLPSANVESTLSLMDSLRFPIGWSDDSVPWYVELVKSAPASFAGWLLTAFAISFGAPFWFDLLNRFMIIRSTVKPRAETPGMATGSSSPGKSGS